MTSLPDLLGAADIISLHIPQTSETRSSDQRGTTLAHMKRGAVLINTARGGLVDEPALIASLNSGHLGGGTGRLRN